MGKRFSKMPRILNCIQCGGDIPIGLQNHPRTKYCGASCRSKAQRTKDKDKIRERLRAWKAANPDRVKELRRLSQKRHPDSATRRRKRWLSINQEKMKASRKNWKKNNPAARAEDTRYRQLIKINATPSWLTIEQRKAIRQIYKDASAKTRETGIPYEVDHIVPIRGKSVCGLHVPWNLQVITRAENQRKRNTLI